MTYQSHLTELESAGLIRLGRVDPEVEYLFRHVLVQEAAYDSLIKGDRANLHRAVAEALGGLYAGREDELAGLLAHHWAGAGEAGRAIEYSRRAARHARALFAYEEAVAHLERALSMAPPGDHNSKAELLEELGDLHGILRTGQSAIRAYREALSLRPGPAANVAADSLRLHRKIVQTNGNMKWSAKFETREYLQPIVEESRAELRAVVHAGLPGPQSAESTRVLIVMAEDALRSAGRPDVEAAGRLARAAVATAEGLHDPDVHSSALETLSNVLYSTGDLRERVAVNRRRIDLCERVGFRDRRERVNALAEAGGAWLHVGEFSEALPLLERAERLASEIRAIDQLSFALSLQAQCLFWLDRWGELRQVEDKWNDLERRYPLERVGPTCYEAALSAVVHARRGESSEAGDLRDRAHRVMANVSGPVEQWLRNQHF